MNMTVPEGTVLRNRYDGVMVWSHYHMSYQDALSDLVPPSAGPTPPSGSDHLADSSEGAIIYFTCECLGVDGDNVFMAAIREGGPGHQRFHRAERNTDRSNSAIT